MDGPQIASTRAESPYVPHSMTDLVAMIAIASCDAMTPPANWSPHPHPVAIAGGAIAHPIARDTVRHSVPGRVVQGERGRNAGVVSPPPSNVINIFIYIIFITLRACRAATAIPA
jgi:hypothetical protein